MGDLETGRANGRGLDVRQGEKNVWIQLEGTNGRNTNAEEADFANAFSGLMLISILGLKGRVSYSVILENVSSYGLATAIQRNANRPLLGKEPSHLTYPTPSPDGLNASAVRPPPYRSPRRPLGPLTV